MNIKWLYLFIFVALFIYITRSQKLNGDPCPDFQPLQNFQDCNYSGLWYEYKKYFPLTEPTAVCTTDTVSLEGNKLFITHQHTDYVPNPNSVVSTIPRTDRIDLVYSGDNTVAQFNATFKLMIIPILKNVDYRILDTDYTSYSIAFACKDINITKLKFVWVWVRKLDDRKKLKSKINSILERYNITNTMKTLHFLC